MISKSIRLAAWLGLIGVIFLSACTGKATPTETAGTTTVPAEVPIAYPGVAAYPDVGDQPQVSYPDIATAPYPETSDAYPLVEATEESVPYPQPSVDPDLLATASSYPGPGAVPDVTEQPYPAPGTDTPATLNPTSPVATATPLVVNTPTIRPTRDIFSELRATDPGKVQLASGKVQLIEFFAFWDGTSKSMAPLMNGLEAEYKNRMNFVFLDIDDPANAAFKKQLGFKIQPQFFLLDENGVVIKKWQGVVKEEEFRAAFDAALT